MSNAKTQILAEVARLLDSGKSLVITTIDEVEESAARRFAHDDVVPHAGRRRCIQRVILPDGTVICIKYED